MRTRKLRTTYLPYLVAFLGIFLSFGLWLLIREQIPRFFEFYKAVRDIHPWMDLIFGIAISILFGMMVGFIELLRENSHHLSEINQELEREIIERKIAEESEEKLEAALLQGQKLQAIGTLAGGIAHDFNNLLYAILGYVELARDDLAEDSITYKNLGKVLEAGHRGQELVARILAFSRRQPHHQDPLKLNAVIESALSLLRPTIPASVDILFEPDFDPTIMGNQTQLHQVIVNLITNAVDAMDDAGTITIKTSQINKDDPVLKNFPQTLPQNYCKIEISDTGHGIEQSLLERIFEPFFTTKEVGKGTGLGLSIVHSIIKEHQGEITVASEPGTGTTFTILIPELLA